MNSTDFVHKSIDEVLVTFLETTLIVPTAFVSGITGQLYKQFALTIAISTAFSGFNALTLTPALCALFLEPPKESKFIVYRWFNRFWTWFEGLYTRCIGRMLKHDKVAMLVYLAITTTFQGSTPQYRLKFDRDRAELMGISLESIYNTLSSFMGQGYINDFDEFGRSFQVVMKGAGSARANVDDVMHLSVANAQGEMVPFSSFTTIEPMMGVSTVNRYNMYTTAGVTATPAKGVSSSECIKEMELLVHDKLGKNYSYAWTGEAYQETQSGLTVNVVFIFAIIMTILVLAAQYESWSDPIAVVLAMPVAMLGTVFGCMCMNQSISIYTQIGLILLLGMAAKNAILIVEFAMDYRKKGVPIIQAAQEAGQIPFRPIMMTALAFVFGVMPMLFASGPGAGSRKPTPTSPTTGASG